jgi:hypothetical protein
MSIAVTCSGCSVKLNVPDSAAGKKVKCPKPGCGAILSVPAPRPDFEVIAVVPPAPLPKPKPRPVKAVVEVDDDDDERPRKTSRRDDDDEEEDGDRPRKKKKKKSAGMSPGVLVGIVLGGLLVLGGAGYGVYALVSKKSDSAGGGGNGSGQKAAVPTSWVAYTAANDKFKAYFPAEPKALTLPAGPGSVPGAESVTLHMSDMKKGDGKIVGIIVLRFKPSATAAEREQAVTKFRQGMTDKGTKVTGPQTVNWGGQSAQELILSEASIKKGAGRLRYMTVDNLTYIGIIGTDAAGRAPAAEEDGFFDNFELLK